MQGGHVKIMENKGIIMKYKKRKRKKDRNLQE